MALKLRSLPVNKTWLMLVVAIVLALLSTVLIARYLQNRESSIAEELRAKAQGGPKISVVVPVRDLPVGTALSEGTVAARDVPADLLYPGAITVEQFDSIKNQGLIRPVTKGRPLLIADIRPMYSDFAGSLKEGTRAMTIDVDELNSVAHMVQPGNRIDLMLAMKRDDGGQTVVPFMDSMKVLATGQRVYPDSELGNANHRALAYSNLTLEVTPSQAARLTLAQDLGKLRFTLRNEKDKQSDEFSVNAQNIMDEISARARESRSTTAGPTGLVEFIVGGQRSGPNAKTIDVQAPNSVTPPAPVVPPIAPQAQAAPASNTGVDANGLTPAMKADLKNMLDQ